MKKLSILVVALVFLMSACDNEGKKDGEVSKADSGTVTEKSFIPTETSKSLSYKTDNTLENGQDQCRDILSQGLMREFKFTSKKDYVLALKRAITSSDEQIRQTNRSNNVNASIGIKILTLGFGSSSSDQDYLNIKKKYMENTSLDISEHDLQQIEIRIADPVIVQAWSDCMGGNKNGISYKVFGDVAKDFTVQLVYIPTSAFDPKVITLNNFVISKGITPVAPLKFKSGLKLRQYESTSQQFSRKNNDAATITIDSRYKPVSIALNRIVPEPETEEIWTKTDENGNLYKQVFYATTPECHDCSDKPLIVWSRTETLDNKNGKIYRVDRDCSGSGCGWNYSSASDGYGIVYHILDPGNQFWYERRIGGVACTEINTAYYEVKRRVPKNLAK